MRDFSHVKRIVIKVGTALLSSEDGIDKNRIDKLCSQIASLKSKGYQVLLVSSGAIGLGAKEIKHKNRVCHIPMRQACAAIGQPILMSHYRENFLNYGIISSQVLLTRSDLNNRKTYVNLRASVSTLLAMGVVPIFNENDTVSTAEIGTAFGDNDSLSAMIASKIDADLLLLLTDIDALYTANPKKDKEAIALKEIDVIDKKIMSYASGAGSTFSTGGMKTKLLAAQIASLASCATIIASGKIDNIIELLFSGEEIGTYIHPLRRLTQRQRWILNNSESGKIIVDNGASDALLKHNSLLFKGIVDILGSFDVGDVVSIKRVDGSSFAKAVVNFSSNDLVLLKGKSTKEATNILKNKHKDCVFRPDDMVLLENVSKL